MAGLRRGMANAMEERKCRPCRTRQHTECEHELGLRALQEYRESGFGPEGEPQVPFCACFVETDIHV